MQKLALFLRTCVPAMYARTQRLTRNAQYRGVLMSALYVANPKVYNGVMRKLERLQDE